MRLTVRLCCPIFFGLFAIACDSDASLSAPSQVPDAGLIQRIAVLGDSLAISPSLAEAFPIALQQRLDGAGLPWTVVNAGVRGDTTTGGLRRLDEVLAQRPRILIVALGGNDGLRGVDVDVVAQNLKEIITRARARGIGVLLCGLETPPLRGWSYTVAFHNLFPALAREHNVPLVPFLLAGVALDPEMNLDDMIHPNAAGARRIAATVWPYLEPMVRAETRQ